MLNDNELNRLRGAFFRANVPLTYSRDEAVRLAWADVLLDPTPDSMRVLMSVNHGGDDHRLLLAELVEIGVAHAPDVLQGLPLSLDDVADRRWQLRRELADIVAGMDNERLQRLVYWGRSIAQ